MLQIGIHDHDDVAAGMVEPGGDRDLLAEIPAEGNGIDARVGFVQQAQHRKRAVPAAIVDADDLPGGDAAIEHALQPLDQERQVVGLVMDGDDDGKLGPPWLGGGVGRGGEGLRGRQGFDDLSAWDRGGVVMARAGTRTGFAGGYLQHAR